MRRPRAVDPFPVTVAPVPQPTSAEKVVEGDIIIDKGGQRFLVLRVAHDNQWARLRLLCLSTGTASSKRKRPSSPLLVESLSSASQAT